MEKKIIFTPVEPNRNLLWLHYREDQLVLEKFGSNGWESIGDTDYVTEEEFKDLQENTIRTDISQDFSNAQQDVALSNIGLKWVNVPYSLLNTTLDDATYAKIKNANGLILTDAPSEYYGPPEFICGANNNDGNKVFVGFNLTNTAAHIVLYTNHNLTNIRYSRTYAGAVPYDTLITLTDTQKQQARTNIGVKSPNELLADDDFIAQLKTKLETV